MSVTKELVSHVLETRFEAIPKEIVKRAKYQVIDIIGCSIVGANAPGCPTMVDSISTEKDMNLGDIPLP